jgi:hypothetical protein
MYTVKPQFYMFKGLHKTNVKSGKYEENSDLLYTITLENHLKYTILNTNNVIVNENMVLRLFYNDLSTAVFI